MNLTVVSKKMIVLIAVLTAAIIIIGAAYYRSPATLRFAVGALLSGLLNVSKVILLDRATLKMVGMETARSANYMRLSSFIRFILSAFVIGACVFLNRYVNLWGLGIGLSTLHLAALSMKYVKSDGNPKQTGV